MIEINIRPMCEDDKNFVFATWLKNYRYSSDFARLIDNDTFYYEHHKIVEYLLKKPKTQVMIAHVKDEPDIILGYLAHELPKTIHYLFIKEGWRKLGIAKRLVLSSEIDLNSCQFTHWTYPMRGLIRKYPKLVYNPYAI